MIDQEHSHVQSLGHQAEFTMNVDDPLNKEGSRGVLDLGGDLDTGQVVRLQLVAVLFDSHVGENGESVLSDKLGLTHVELIREAHVFRDHLLVGLQAFLIGLRHGVCRVLGQAGLDLGEGREVGLVLDRGGPAARSVESLVQLIDVGAGFLHGGVNLFGVGVDHLAGRLNVALALFVGADRLGGFFVELDWYHDQFRVANLGRKHRLVHYIIIGKLAAELSVIGLALVNLLGAVARLEGLSLASVESGVVL